MLYILSFVLSLVLLQECAQLIGIYRVLSFLSTSDDSSGLGSIKIEM